MEDETPLQGGRSTAGVVRCGDTVRRPLCDNSAFVHALLRHLENEGFPYAPRFVGVDSQGREILTYVEGWVPPDLGFFAPAQIAEAARIISLFHESTAGTPIAGTQEVVCHRDLSPCNFVFRSGVPVSMIDFDTAAPGPRRLDVGYAAWAWLDIGNPDLDAEEVGHRLGSFLAAYGPQAPTDPIEAVLQAQDWLAQRASTSTSNPTYAGDVLAWAHQCRDWVRRHSHEISAGLRTGAA